MARKYPAPSWLPEITADNRPAWRGNHKAAGWSMKHRPRGNWEDCEGQEYPEFDMDYGLSKKEVLKLEMRVMGDYVQSGHILNELAEQGWDNKRIASLIASLLLKIEAGDASDQHVLRTLDLLKQIMGQSERQDVEVETKGTSEDIKKAIMDLLGDE